jgi:hypothetical protein
MTPVETWNDIMVAVITLFSVVVLICYVARRNTFPIAQRMPMVVIFEITCVAAMGIVSSLNYAQPDDKPFMSCLHFVLLFQVLNFLGTAAILFRVQTLFMKYFSTKLLIQQANADEFSDEVSAELKLSRNDTFLFKFMYSLLQFEFKHLGIWGASLVHILPILIAVIVSMSSILASSFDGLTSKSPDCILLSTSPNSAYAFNAIDIYLVFFCIPIFVMFKGREDSLYLVAELRCLLLFLGFSVFGVVLLSIAPQTWEWLVFLETMFLLGVFSFPIYISFKVQKEQQKEGKKDASGGQASSIGEVIEELRSVISTPEQRNLFLKHLELEYSVENLSFYEACNSLEIMIQMSRSREEILEKAKFIRDTFILTSAISCVNISHPNRLKVLEVLGDDQMIPSVSNQAIIEALKSPKEEILKLMATDSFGRFKRSDVYQEEKNRKRPKSSLLERSLNTISSAGKASRFEDTGTDLELLSPLKE